jgi:hypothetical protein
MTAVPSELGVAPDLLQFYPLCNGLHSPPSVLSRDLAHFRR